MAQTSGSGAGGGVGSGANQFGDTTYTKVFVGGLAWETQRDTMRRHFEQFGDILEAVVITDKNTGRSKGYGFVTFRDADAARRACADATPIIDGRRANCNLASLGAHRNRPAHGGPHGPQAGGPGYTPSAPFAQPGPFTYPQQGFTYPQYGYPQYPPDYSYPQFPQQIYGGPGTLGSTGVYPYSGFTQPIQGGPGYPSPQGYGAPHLMQYGTPGVSAITSMAPYGGGAVPLQTPSPSTGEHDNLIMSNAEFGELQGRQVGVTPALAAAGVAVPSQQFGVPAPSQQQFSSGGGPDQPTG